MILMQSDEMVKRLRELDMPVFTTRDISSLTGKSAQYTKVFLSLLVKRKKIEKIERGRYCLVGTSPYVIASRVVNGSYVALISAARFHNITTQLPSTILVFSIKYHRPMSIKGNYKIRFVKINKDVIYGYNEYNGAYVSDVEKIFVDDAYYHRSLSYTEELETVVGRGILDMGKLRAYVKRLGKKGVTKVLCRGLREFNISI
jgi:predicted transcriptional regulator of viral defense system